VSSGENRRRVKATKVNRNVITNNNKNKNKKKEESRWLFTAPISLHDAARAFK